MFILAVTVSTRAPIDIGAANAMDRLAVRLDETSPVVLEGKILCRDCELEHRYGVKASCKTIGHHGEALRDDAYVAEASLKHADWTVFGRGEITENRELLDLEEHGPAYRVGKVSLGAVRDFRIAEHFTLGAGGLLAVNFVPDSLAPLYGGHNPIGAMGFLRLKLD